MTRCLQIGNRSRVGVPKRTDTATHCPYKGTSRYWSINTTGEVHDNLAWGYDAPVRESEPIAGYVAFYNEKLDIYVDGVLEEKPKTVFS